MVAFTSQDQTALWNRDESETISPEEVERNKANVDELLDKWPVELGQIWQVGRHRIACGDCRDIELTDRLFNGVQCQICWTDPPYNVNLGDSKGGRGPERGMQNDNWGDQFPIFAAQFCTVIAHYLMSGALIYMAMSSQEWPTIDKSLRDAGFHWSSTIIWVKDHAVLTRKDYHTRFEPIWYGWKDDAARLVPLADRAQNDVWEIERPMRSVLHPSTKPLELVKRSLVNSSCVGDSVFDPFLGSGTTAMVAEQTGRVCYGIEIEPRYVAVVLERLSVKGLAPSLIGGLYG